MLDDGPLSRYDGKFWTDHYGRRIDWRSILPFLKKKLVEIERVPRSSRQVMKLTTLGEEWAKKFVNHRASAAFAEARARSMKAAKRIRVEKKKYGMSLEQYEAMEDKIS